MSFFTIEELKTVAPVEFIEIVKGTDDEVLDEIIIETISLMRTNLGPYYDMNSVFNQVGTMRDNTILMYLKDLVWYKLKKRRKPGGNLNDESYNEAMKWLEDVSSGNRLADLPPKKTDLDGDGIEDESVPFMKLGSRKTYVNGW